MRYSDYFLFFAAVCLAFGILGYVRAKSTVSAFAGGVSAALLAVAGIMALKHDHRVELARINSPGTDGLGINWGYVTGLVVCVLLLGRFLPGYLKTKKIYPSGLMSLLSVLGIAAGIAGLVSRP